MSDPRFDAPSGAVIGRRDGAVLRATGIPYATAARFGGPAPAADRTEPFVAHDWSPQAPQPADPIADTMFGVDPRGRATDEHCQHLSITLPAAPASTPRPVLVWVHGGGFVTGAGDLAIMDPAALVTEQDVVVVTVTYRLGLLGFIETPHGPRANLGLLDLIEAFRWIRRNIAAFGGDPASVTAFGQSAGAQALVDLMATKDAAQLFTRAVIQSAPLGIMRGRAALNRALAAAAAPLGASSTLADVAAVQEQVVATGARFGLKGAMPIAPQYGCAPLPPEAEVDAALASVAPAIDVLIGSTTEEARLFLPSLPGVDTWSRLPVVGGMLERLVVWFCTWAVYTRGVRRFARRHRRAGGLVSTYALSWAALGNPIGAAHTIDLPLLLGDQTAWADAQLIAGTPYAEVAADGRRMRALWARFARGEQLGAGDSLEFLALRG
ncbi:MAG: carboxylesterase [Microbacterium sp. SCN 70-200]|uniref:carboxylesterase family protein n=1 Tax=unclassified Microbacterium TaxID=2609290 RepID=UPI0008696FD6|nr:MULTISPECIES: carboxylesterase family protein [unclassified Microbacterium]MBN9214874.1 carboxylesterase/lipase family protein [Microbacterium sp.]ODT43019.1 MAG: carboxylesterase [Microbacterium sp. SCN 70-200]OJV84676.1 MAG: carboxylesterase [Microbacterium sp. 70-16]